MASKESVFRSRFSKLISDREISHTECARLLHISAQSVYNYTKGKRTPTVDLIPDICSVFRVSADYLVGTEDIVHSKASTIAEKSGLSIRAAEALSKMNDEQLHYVSDMILLEYSRK